MKIRNDLAKSVVMDYISETFSHFEFNGKNIGNLIAVKLYVHNNYDDLIKVVSKDGYIDISAIEDVIIEDVNKLGKFEVPAIGTKYMFSSDDVKRLINKLKEKADE
jgi:predicted RecB family nuclease